MKEKEGEKNQKRVRETRQWRRGETKEEKRKEENKTDDKRGEEKRGKKTPDWKCS